MQHASNVRSRPIGLRMDRPFPHGVALVGGTVDALSVEVDDDEIFRIESPPTHGPRLDQNPLVIKLYAQITSKAEGGDLGRVKDPAGLHHFLTKIGFGYSSHTYTSAARRLRKPSSNGTSRFRTVEAERTQYTSP